MNVESLSQPELLTLLSILEGELEARDLVIEALKVRHRTAAKLMQPIVSRHTLPASRTQSHPADQARSYTSDWS